MVVVCGYRFIIGTLAESKVWCSLVGWLDMRRSLCMGHVMSKILAWPLMHPSPLTLPTSLRSFKTMAYYGTKVGRKWQFSSTSWHRELRLATSLGKGHALWPFQCWMVDFSSFKAPREGVRRWSSGRWTNWEVEGLGCSWWWFCWYILYKYNVGI